MSGNYTYRDGYWWSNGVACTRTRQAYYTTGYCSSRRCSTRSLAYRWVYRRSSYQPAVQPQYVTPKTEGWRTKLLEIAATRDRYEASTRASANEHNEFIEAVEALGLTSNFTWRGYGNAPNMAQGYGYSSQQYGNSGYSQPVAQQGSTITGYNEYVADIYGNLDLQALYEQALRNRSSAREMESQAASETHQLLDGLGERAGAVAEIQAQSQALSSAMRELRGMLDSMRPQSRARIEKREYEVSPTGPATDQTNAQPSAGTRNSVGAALQGLFDRKCTSCHSPGKAATEMSGIDLSDFTKLTTNDVERIIASVETNDPAKRMPRAADGGAAPPLTAFERRLIIYAAGPPPADPTARP